MTTQQGGLFEQQLESQDYSGCSPHKRRMSRTAWTKLKRRPRHHAKGTLESQQINGQERFWRVYSEAETGPIRGNDTLPF